jgi:biofilm PGA synthesis N-glycosyltransferase PgaC
MPPARSERATTDDGLASADPAAGLAERMTIAICGATIAGSWGAPGRSSGFGVTDRRRALKYLRSIERGGQLVGSGARGPAKAKLPRIAARTRKRPAAGLRPTSTFAIMATLNAGYVGFAVWVSDTWRNDLAHAIGPVMAWVIPLTLAYIPGATMGFLMFTLLATRYREPNHSTGAWPAATVLIAARDEERAIVPTLEAIAELAYEGPVEIVLADNNSTDRTAQLAEAAAQRLRLHYRRILEVEPGKHHALNNALAQVTTPLVVTVDADTVPHPSALTHLVARVMSTPQGQHVCACAGALVPANARDNFLTRMQQWDYRLGMNGVKRVQATYNSTLVAQGAFSAYWTEDLRAVGGWPDAIGEDIVLTWTLLASRGLVQYEPVALGFTVVPKHLRAFVRQRARWARGMFEGLRHNPPSKQPRVLARLTAGIDYLVPFIDIGVILFWLPGFILFLFGYPLIVSWWSMLLLPITLLVFGVMRRWQERHVFRSLGVPTHPDRRGFLGFLFLYRVLNSGSSLLGYGQFLRGARRRWK